MVTALHHRDLGLVAPASAGNFLYSCRSTKLLAGTPALPKPAPRKGICTKSEFPIAILT